MQRSRTPVGLVVGLLLLSGATALAEPTWDPSQQAVLAAIGRLSASTAPGGGGADAYGAILADDFSRWTVGSTELNDKGSWVDGIRGWFDDGWRVVDRKSTNLEIRVVDRNAYSRRIVEETYQGPDGDRSSATAAVAEVWVNVAASGEGEGADWRLFLVNVHPIPDE